MEDLEDQETNEITTLTDYQPIPNPRETPTTEETYQPLNTNDHQGILSRMLPHPETLEPNQDEIQDVDSQAKVHEEQMEQEDEPSVVRNDTQDTNTIPDDEHNISADDDTSTHNNDDMTETNNKEHNTNADDDISISNDAETTESDNQHEDNIDNDVTESNGERSRRNMQTIDYALYNRTGHKQFFQVKKNSSKSKTCSGKWCV